MKGASGTSLLFRSHYRHSFILSWLTFRAERRRLTWYSKCSDGNKHAIKVTNTRYTAAVEHPTCRHFCPPHVTLVSSPCCPSPSSARPESSSLWDRVSAANQQVEDQLRWLTHRETSTRRHQSQSAREAAAMLDRTISHLSELPASEWSTLLSPPAQVDVDVVECLLSIRSAFIAIRSLYRMIGEGSQVDIEPRNQTRLCDETNRQPGVVAAGVPGAGGEDAVFVLVLSSAAAGDSASTEQMARLRRMWLQFGLEVARSIQQLPVQLSESGLAFDNESIDVAPLTIFRAMTKQV
jgi:hypothetical protein